MTNGSIDFRDIESAIQKVFGDKLDESVYHEYHPGTPRRWRSNTFYGDDGDYDLEDDLIDDEGNCTCACDWPEDEMFEDLICLSDNHEAHLIFAQELPGVMEESEALEVLGHQLEDVFYETQHRFSYKNKGKGKKAKGKGHRTFASGPPGHEKGGGYLEHRRRLQEARNGRGYDRPWQQRYRSRLSINELKAKTRCHQCKQLGHWSQECPHRGKAPSSPARSASSAASTTGAMTTEFFTQPPKAAGFGQFMTTTSDPAMLEQYTCAQFSGLSPCPHGVRTRGKKVWSTSSMVKGVRRLRARHLWTRRGNLYSLCASRPRRKIRSPQGPDCAG